MELLIATNNPGKVKEFKDLLPEFTIRSLADFPQVEDIVEDGHTFEENAIKKATTLVELTGKWALADDSGLEVDALDGAPGIFSARYAGEGNNFERNIQKLLADLNGVDNRTARFRCVIALAAPDGHITTVEGESSGLILHEKRGTGGFGYDPIFLSDELEQTFAEAPPEDKHRVSHRGRAIRKILPHIRALALA